MNARVVISAVLAVLILGVLVGCSSSQPYQNYNQPQQQGQPQQQQYVGGGCGVAPSAGYSAPSEPSGQAAL